MNVPKLRFKEFTDEWKKVELDKLYEFKNGLNGDRSLYGKGVELINVSDILNNTCITSKVINGKININEDTLRKNSVEYGDILFQRSSETFLEIGTSNVYLDNKLVTFSGFVIRGKRKKDNINNPLFINYELKVKHFNFHSLRHTFATNCISLGVDYKTVSELLRHANVNITLNLYVHPRYSQKKKCIDLVCKVFQEKVV